jgi:hypothetical protein
MQWQNLERGDRIHPTEFSPSVPARVISRGGSAGTRCCQFVQRRGWLARNGRSRRSSRTWPDGALRIVPCDNAGEPKQPNGPKIAPPCEQRRAKPTIRTPYVFLAGVEKPPRG